MTHDVIVEVLPFEGCRSADRDYFVKMKRRKR